MNLIELEKKALYNSLRLSVSPHEIFGGTKVESWQVENYRLLSLGALFDRLAYLGLPLDSPLFIRHADEWDTPEELLDDLMPDELLRKTEDQVYLLIFELWRRLIPEKQSLSIFCDELDCQILEYDRDARKNGEQMADILANLQEVLDENADEGGDPQEVFSLLRTYCASDLERFLYDYTAGQVDEESFDYAAELYEGFYPYLSDPKWFDLLHARILSETDPEGSAEELQELLDDDEIEPELDFDFEILQHLCQIGTIHQFQQVIFEMVPMLETEGDFQELLGTCAHYFRCLDWEDQEGAVEEISSRREDQNPDASFSFQDPDAQTLIDLTRNL